MWFMKDDIASEFVTRIKDDPKSESDRSVGIVLGALIDARLSDVIKANIHQNKKMMDEYFRDGGVFGSFAARVAMGYMMGVFGLDTYNELLCITKIRNRFAHKLDAQGFDSQGIRELVDNLPQPETRTIVVRGESFTWEIGDREKIDNRRDKFIYSTYMLCGLFYVELLSYASEPKREPRF